METIEMWKKLAYAMTVFMKMKEISVSLVSILVNIVLLLLSVHYVLMVPIELLQKNPIVSVRKDILMMENYVLLVMVCVLPV
jgi:hypothetical protein